jgi:hypothetical protein
MIRKQIDGEVHFGLAVRESAPSDHDGYAFEIWLPELSQGGPLRIYVKSAVMWALEIEGFGSGKLSNAKGEEVKKPFVFAPGEYRFVATGGK